MSKKRNQLSEVVRSGLQHLLELALEAEINQFIRGHDHRVGEDGLKQIVRNGYHGERTVLCAIGSITLSVPRSRDQRKNVSHKTVFQSRIVPRYLRTIDALNDLIPEFYLKGMMTGDFSGVFSLLLGEEGAILSTSSEEWLYDKWKTYFNSLGWGIGSVGSCSFSGDWGSGSHSGSDRCNDECVEDGGPDETAVAAEVEACAGDAPVPFETVTETGDMPESRRRRDFPLADWKPDVHWKPIYWKRFPWRPLRPADVVKSGFMAAGAQTYGTNERQFHAEPLFMGCKPVQPANQPGLEKSFGGFRLSLNHRA
ncbi:MAG: hypothetical protein GY940_15185 [bacterium]|nr:hypothetical protein [bacterium]